MTREQKIEMFTMRLDGHSLQDIGNKLGVTREYVRQVLEKSVQKEAVMKKARDKIIFPNIANWMEVNQISIGDLTVLMGYTSGNSNYAMISRRLRNLDIWRMKDILSILKVTGMTFEEAFHIEHEEAAD